MEAAVATLAQDRSVRTVVLVSRGPLYLTAGARQRSAVYRTLGADGCPARRERIQRALRYSATGCVARSLRSPARARK
jgi:hypothetical protein